MTRKPLLENEGVRKTHVSITKKNKRKARTWPRKSK